MNESIFLCYICNAKDDIHLEHSGEIFSEGVVVHQRENKTLFLITGFIEETYKTSLH